MQSNFAWIDIIRALDMSLDMMAFSSLKHGDIKKVQYHGLI